MVCKWAVAGFRKTNCFFPMFHVVLDGFHNLLAGFKFVLS
jgi:hypothetical protein